MNLIKSSNKKKKPNGVKHRKLFITFTILSLLSCVAGGVIAIISYLFYYKSIIVSASILGFFALFQWGFLIIREFCRERIEW